MIGLFLIAGKLAAWKFSGQKKKIFVHNAVHDQIAVLGSLSASAIFHDKAASDRHVHNEQPDPSGEKSVPGTLLF